MPKVVHFEITSTDPQTTAEFYNKAFGWPVSETKFVEGYFMLGQEDEVSGAAMDRSLVDQPVILWFHADRLEPMINEIVRAGGAQVNAIQVLPGVGRVVYMREPSGTVFGLREPAGPLPN